jgi:hypothetical protein
MTYAQALAIAITAIGDTNAEAVERLNALTAQLAKRSSKGGMTKTQKANEGLKDIILEILTEAEEFVPMADIMADERLTDLSPQKMGALLGQLIKADKAQRHVHKKRTLYAVKGVEFVAPDAEPADGETE